MPSGIHSNPTCQCMCCKSKRGEFSGKKHPMYGKERSSKVKDKISKKLTSQHPTKRLNYFKRHWQIIKLKGKAKEYKCIDCNKQAQQWSNIDHKYSDNPNDYLPRCRRCHLNYDNILNYTQAIQQI